MKKGTGIVQFLRIFYRGHPNLGGGGVMHILAAKGIIESY